MLFRSQRGSSVPSLDYEYLLIYEPPQQPGSNTVSLFSIDAEDPTKLTQVGKAVPSGGEFPESVTINSKGTTACVLNGGAVNGVK